MKQQYPIIGAGSFLETLINETIIYYESQNIAFIWKNNPNYVIKNGVSSVGFNTIKPNGCDYTGIWNGQFLEFEVKSTKSNYLKISSINTYQKKRLKLIHQYHGQAFVIIYFSSSDRYFLVMYSIINESIGKGVNRLDMNYCTKKGYELFIQYPLYLPIVNCLSN